MKRRISGETLLLLGLIALLGILSFRIARQSSQNGPEGARPRRTITSARPGGWKAFYRLLQQRGVQARPLEAAPDKWPKSARVIVTGEEYFTLSAATGTGATFWNEEQASDALKWVDNGGTLFLLSGQTNALTDKLKLTLDNGLHTNAVLAPVQPAPFLANVKGVLLPDEGRWTRSPGGIPLLSDGKPAVAFFSRGKGIIIAVASAAIADNAHIAKNDNARFLTQIVETYAARGGDASGGGVYFDEFHQGFQAAPSLTDALGQPGQWAVLQLIAVSLLVAFTAGKRFGMPRPVPAASRVSSEYVQSLADLYARARARDAALEGVYLSFWRDLCRAVGVPLDTPAEDVAKRAAATLGNDYATDTAAARRRQDREARLTRLVTECETKINGGPKAVREAELLALARQIEGMRKELGIGRNDGANTNGASNNGGTGGL